MNTRFVNTMVALSVACFLNTLGAQEIKSDAKPMEMNKVQETKVKVDEPVKAGIDNKVDKTSTETTVDSRSTETRGDRVNRVGFVNDQNRFRMDRNDRNFPNDRNDRNDRADFCQR
jgi:hypothetical protein